MNPSAQQSVNFDLEKLLPLELIRAHTKTLDIVTVTDEQLRVYREAALDAAEGYTGRWLRGRRWVSFALPQRQRLVNGVATIRLRWSASEGHIYLRGPRLGTQSIPVEQGARRVEVYVPPFGDVINRCCDPCVTDAEKDLVSYYTGYACVEDIPGPIKIGMLRYIAFQITHTGDISNTILNDLSAVGLTTVSSNAVVASGAAAEWRPYSGGVLA